MTYRVPKALAGKLAGAGARSLRALISVRQLVTDTYEATERVLARGRASLDAAAGADGAFDELHAENCQPVGLVARPAEHATVVAIVANAGGDGANPYILGTIDGTREIVLDARGRGFDLALLYNTTDVLEIKNGKVVAGSLSGSTAPVAFKSDVDSVNARVAALETAVNALIVLYNAHTHVVSGAPPVTAPPATPAATAATSATVQGTQRFEAE